MHDSSSKKAMNTEINCLPCCSSTVQCVRLVWHSVPGNPQAKTKTEHVSPHPEQLGIYESAKVVLTGSSLSILFDSGFKDMVLKMQVIWQKNENSCRYTKLSPWTTSCHLTMIQVESK